MKTLAARVFLILLLATFAIQVLSFGGVMIGTAHAEPAPEVAGVAGRAEPAPEVAMRTGTHANFGRVVFEVPPGSKPEVRQVGTRLTVKFADAASVRAGAAAPPPHNH